MIKKHIVIIPTHVPWEWPADVINQTAILLSKKNIVITFIWNNTLSLKEHFAQKCPPQIFSKYSKNLYIFRPILLVPFRRFKFIISVNMFINVFLLRSIAKYFEFKSGFKKKILWIFYPNFYNLVKLCGPRYKILYDCSDYFLIGDSKEKELIKKNEIQLLKNADLVVANSKVLVRHCQKIRKDTILVPQGFRIETFFSKNKKFRKICTKTPVIGLIGGINDRIDFNLLYSLARDHPQWVIVLWGPIQERYKSTKISQKIKILLELPNIIYGFSEDKNEIPSILKQFDIGMIPYISRNIFNKYCYPMKLFEYFWQGLPVISKPIEELKRFPNFVSIAESEEEWTKAITYLLSRKWSQSYKIKQRKLAIENSWKNKIELISHAYLKL